MSTDQLIKELDELEAMAELMAVKASMFKDHFCRAREALHAGVSTPANPTKKDLSKVGADAVARRHKRLNKKK